jgi:hypothetical protein
MAEEQASKSGWLRRWRERRRARAQRSRGIQGRVNQGRRDFEAYSGAGARAPGRHKPPPGGGVG